MAENQQCPICDLQVPVVDDTADDKVTCPHCSTPLIRDGMRNMLIYVVEGWIDHTRALGQLLEDWGREFLHAPELKATLKKARRGGVRLEFAVRLGLEATVVAIVKRGNALSMPPETTPHSHPFRSLVAVHLSSVDVQIFLDGECISQFDRHPFER